MGDNQRNQLIDFTVASEKERRVSAFKRPWADVGITLLRHFETPPSVAEAPPQNPAGIPSILECLEALPCSRRPSRFVSFAPSPLHQRCRTSVEDGPRHAFYS